MGDVVAAEAKLGMKRDAKSTASEIAEIPFNKRTGPGTRRNLISSFLSVYSYVRYCTCRSKGDSNVSKVASRFSSRKIEPATC